MQRDTIAIIRSNRVGRRGGGGEGGEGGVKKRDETRRGRVRVPKRDASKEKRGSDTGRGRRALGEFTIVNHKASRVRSRVLRTPAHRRSTLTTTIIFVVHSFLCWPRARNNVDAEVVGRARGPEEEREGQDSSVESRLRN